jgi:hypothetical protein
MAVLILVAAGALFYAHRSTMAETWAAPNFSPEAKPITGRWSEVGNLSLALGRFQRETPREEGPKEVPKDEPIEGEIAKHGEITDAIIVYPPYEEGGLAPALIFKLRAGGELRTIRLGEAILERPNPKSSHYPIPVKFKFVGCERDPESPGSTCFLFDVDCDGKNIQKARWKFEEPAKALPPVEGGPAEPAPVNTEKMFVGDPLSALREEPAKPEEAVQTEPVVPVTPEPPQETVTVEQAPAGTFFEEEEGILAPTAEGIEYLEKNYEKILEDTRTAPNKDRDGRTGVRIVSISNASVANQFGIMKDDVILKINGIPVSSQQEAVSAVKGELKKKPAVRVIRVTIRRRGREIEKSFDTRDPATRRAAKKAFR